MKIGDSVTITRGGKIIESETIYSDAEKSCGYVRLSPKDVKKGHIVGLKLGWLNDYWIVGLENGEIVRIPV